jgi:hypothetical protein
MRETGQLIIQSAVGLMSLCIVIIVVRFLLWPLFKKQPVVVGLSLAMGVVAIGLMFAFNV